MKTRIPRNTTEVQPPGSAQADPLLIELIQSVAPDRQPQLIQSLIANHPDQAAQLTAWIKANHYTPDTRSKCLAAITSAKTAPTPAAAAPKPPTGDPTHKIRQSNAPSAYDRPYRAYNRPADLVAPNEPGPLAAYFRPYVPNQAQPEAIQQPTALPQDLTITPETHAAADIETGRIARALKKHHLQCWFAQQTIRRNATRPRLTETEIHAILTNYNQTNNIRGTRKLLKRGNNTYWTIKATRAGITIQLISQTKTAARLYRLAAKYQPQALKSAKPGKHRQAIQITGDKEERAANLYKAWITAHANKNGEYQISFSTQSQLWNASASTIQNWQTLAGISHRAAFTEFDRYNDLAPAHAYPALDQASSIYLTARDSNIYLITSARRTCRTGTNRRIRDLMKRKRFSQPILKELGGNTSDGRGRTHYETKVTKRGVLQAHTRLRRHLRRHQDPFRLHTVRMGTRGRRDNVIQEASTGDRLRSLRDRNWKKEATPEGQAILNSWKKYGRNAIAA